MEKLKSAVIGLGHQGLGYHIPALKDSQFATLEAICDIDEDKLNEWQGKLKVPGFTNYVKLFDSTDLDFVIVATPHEEYRRIVEEASKRHLHMLKEKPFASHIGRVPYWCLHTITPNFPPDLIIYLDLDPTIAIERIKEREDLFLDEDLESLVQFRADYRRIMGGETPKQLHGTKILTIDADKNIGTLSEEIYSKVKEELLTL